MNENKKILDGHLPVIPRPRFLHHGFRKPLTLCMRKENVEKPFPPWVRAVSKIYNSIGEFTIPLEVCILMRGVQWALWFVTSTWSECWSDQRFAAKLSPWWAARRRLILNDRHGVISLWILANKPFSFSYFQGLCNGVFLFKIGHKMTSNEARKVGPVTVFSLAKCRLISNDRHGVNSRWILANKPFPLANFKAFATGYVSLKLDIKLLQMKPAK